MKHTILILIAEVLLVICSSQSAALISKDSLIDNNEPISDVVDHSNESFFQKFRPDTLIMDFDYAVFYISESYQINDLKFLFGHYEPSDKGELSPYDSEKDYGRRLLCFNTENQLVFKSDGAWDSWIFIPHFYISNDKKQIVILCQMGFEYFCGTSAFLLENNKVQNIGILDIEPYSEYDYSGPICSVTNIKRINSSLEFTFDTDSLLLDPGGDNILVTNAKYIYKAGKLTLVND